MLVQEGSRSFDSSGFTLHKVRKMPNLDQESVYSFDSSDLAGEMLCVFVQEVVD